MLSHLFQRMIREINLTLKTPSHRATGLGFLQSAAAENNTRLSYSVEKLPWNPTNQGKKYSAMEARTKISNSSCFSIFTFEEGANTTQSCGLTKSRGKGKLALFGSLKHFTGLAPLSVQSCKFTYCPRHRPRVFCTENTKQHENQTTQATQFHLSWWIPKW